MFPVSSYKNGGVAGTDPTKPSKRVFIAETPSIETVEIRDKKTGKKLVMEPSRTSSEDVLKLMRSLEAMGVPAKATSPIASELDYYLYKDNLDYKTAINKIAQNYNLGDINLLGNKDLEKAFYGLSPYKEVRENGFAGVNVKREKREDPVMGSEALKGKRLSEENGVPAEVIKAYGKKSLEDIIKKYGDDPTVEFVFVNHSGDKMFGEDVEYVNNLFANRKCVGGMCHGDTMKEKLTKINDFTALSKRQWEGFPDKKSYKGDDFYDTMFSIRNGKVVPSKRGVTYDTYSSNPDFFKVNKVGSGILDILPSTTDSDLINFERESADLADYLWDNYGDEDGYVNLADAFQEFDITPQQLSSLGIDPSRPYLANGRDDLTDILAANVIANRSQEETPRVAQNVQPLPTIQPRPLNRMQGGASNNTTMKNKYQQGGNPNTLMIQGLPNAQLGGFFRRLGKGINNVAKGVGNAAHDWGIAAADSFGNRLGIYDIDNSKYRTGFGQSVAGFNDKLQSTTGKIGSAIASTVVPGLGSVSQLGSLFGYGAGNEADPTNPTPTTNNLLTNPQMMLLGEEFKKLFQLQMDEQDEIANKKATVQDYPSTNTTFAPVGFAQQGGGVGGITPQIPTLQLPPALKSLRDGLPPAMPKKERVQVEEAAKKEAFELSKIPTLEELDFIFYKGLDRRNEANDKARIGFEEALRKDGFGDEEIKEAIELVYTGTDISEDGANSHYLNNKDTISLFRNSTGIFLPKYKEHIKNITDVMDGFDHFSRSIEMAKKKVGDLKWGEMFPQPTNQTQQSTVPKPKGGYKFYQQGGIPKAQNGVLSPAGLRRKEDILLIEDIILNGPTPTYNTTTPDHKLAVLENDLHYLKKGKIVDELLGRVKDDPKINVFDSRNTKGDAYRHSMSSAQVTRNLMDKGINPLVSLGLANALGAGHELIAPNPKKEMIADLWNNLMGSVAGIEGNEKEVVDRIEFLAKSGLLSYDRKTKKVKKKIQGGYTYQQGGAPQQMMGYKDNSPYRNLASQNFYTDTLTMDGVSKPLLAIANNGQTKIMKPNSGLYNFPGATQITEIPIPLAQEGGQYRVNDEDEMIEGIIEILTQIEDLSNRQEAALNQIEKLRNEGIEIDEEGFMAEVMGEDDEDISTDDIDEDSYEVEDEVEEMREGGMPDRYRKMGFSGVNKPKRTPGHGSKSHAVVVKDGSSYKLIRFGQKGVSGSPKKVGESKSYANRRKSFKARHAANIAKGKTSAAYWANKVKWENGGQPTPNNNDEITKLLGMNKYQIMPSLMATMQQGGILKLKGNEGDPYQYEFDQTTGDYYTITPQGRRIKLKKGSKAEAEVAKRSQGQIGYQNIYDTGVVDTDEYKYYLPDSAIPNDSLDVYGSYYDEATRRDKTGFLRRPNKSEESQDVRILTPGEARAAKLRMQKKFGRQSVDPINDYIPITGVDDYFKYNPVTGDIVEDTEEWDDTLGKPVKVRKKVRGDAYNRMRDIVRKRGTAAGLVPAQDEYTKREEGFFGRLYNRFLFQEGGNPQGLTRDPSYDGQALMSLSGNPPNMLWEENVQRPEGNQSLANMLSNLVGVTQDYVNVVSDEKDPYEYRYAPNTNTWETRLRLNKKTGKNLPKKGDWIRVEGEAKRMLKANQYIRQRYDKQLFPTGSRAAALFSNGPTAPEISVQLIPNRVNPTLRSVNDDSNGFRDKRTNTNYNTRRYSQRPTTYSNAGYEDYMAGDMSYNGEGVLMAPSSVRYEGGDYRNERIINELYNKLINNSNNSPSGVTVFNPLDYIRKYMNGGRVMQNYMPVGNGKTKVESYIPLEAMIPIQTEKKELIVLPTMDLVKVNASKRHSQMKDDEVTDIVPENSYILSQFGSVDIYKSEADQIQMEVENKPYNLYGSNPTPKVKTLGDIMRKKVMKPADLARLVESKYKIIDHDDPFTIQTNAVNKQRRAGYLQAIIGLSEYDKARKGIDNSIETQLSQNNQQPPQMVASNGGKVLRAGYNVPKADGGLGAILNGVASLGNLTLSGIQYFQGRKDNKEAFRFNNATIEDAYKKNMQREQQKSLFGLLGVVNQDPRIDPTLQSDQFVSQMPSYLNASNNNISNSNMSRIWNNRLDTSSMTPQMAMWLGERSNAQALEAQGQLAGQLAGQRANIFSQYLQARQNIFNANSASRTAADNAMRLNRNKMFGDASSIMMGQMENEQNMYYNRANSLTAAKMNQISNANQLRSQFGQNVSNTLTSGLQAYNSYMGNRSNTGVGGYSTNTANRAQQKQQECNARGGQWVCEDGVCFCDN
jgi:hypothetical protein